MGWTIFILATIGWHLGMYGMFRKAGIAPWKALIPFYNTWCIVEKCGIKKVWFWLQLIPVAGQFITIWITIIFVMFFGKFGLLEHTATVFLPFFYFPYLGFSKTEKFKGIEVVKLYKKSAAREWVDAAVFAIVAATLIRTFIFEAYVIPSGSMEKTLLINDYLFVDKLAYGPRIPETPLSFPFVHNTLPFSESKPSYLKWIELPYMRLPGFGGIKRNDVVVFNFPEGDTIINETGYRSENPYYDVLRRDYHGNRDALWAEHDILVHPLDKTDNYIKRCIAVAGDTMMIRNAQLYINGVLVPVPPEAQTDYEVTTNGKGFSDDFLRNVLHLRLADDENKEFYPIGNSSNAYYFNMRAKDVALLRKQPNVVKIDPIVDYDKSYLFPYDSAHKWTIDNYGPVWIPKKNTTVTLRPDNIGLYRRIITVYEGNKLEEKNDGTYLINGKPATTYTFKYNYYWMMGDNRHRSQDSRYWGFVPESCIVGRASLIWFSWDNGPRWSRLLKSIH